MLRDRDIGQRCFDMGKGERKGQEWWVIGPVWLLDRQGILWILCDVKKMEGLCPLYNIAKVFDK